MEMKTVGFIGTGLMGQGMVRNLMKAGYDVTVYNRTKEKAQELLDEGAHWADSLAACAKDKDVVFTIVGYPTEVEAVYFGPGGVLENASPGTVLIDMSTSMPELAVRIAAAAKERGSEALDAPVTGGQKGAREGTLTIMVGGEKEVFERALPLLEAMGEVVRYHGRAGNGQHCKTMNQIGVAGALTALCEIVAYSEAVGMDAAEVIETLRNGSSGSRQMVIYSAKILAKDETPSFYLKHYVKDLKIAVSESESRGRSLPQTKCALGMYETLMERGYGDSGIHTLFRYYEK